MMRVEIETENVIYKPVKYDFIKFDLSSQTKNLLIKDHI